MAQYISAFAWILAFSLFLCIFFRLKILMDWSLELGVLCKSDRESGHLKEMRAEGAVGGLSPSGHFVCVSLKYAGC